MASMTFDALPARRGCFLTSPVSSKWQTLLNNMSRPHLLCSTIRASYSMDDKNKVHNELGLFAFRKKIEDAVLRAEMFGPTALELEEARRIKREGIVRDHNLWVDPVKSNEILVNFADSAKVVDALKDLRYKAEEAKLITELADSDTVNHGLFNQAYKASVDMSKFLDQYEMSKLLRGKYDMHGATIVIKAGDGGTASEIWTNQLLTMYMKWSEKQGHRGRIVEKRSSKRGGIKSAIIDFEFKFAYGYLLGEKGIHRMIAFVNGSASSEPSMAAIDVIPLFLEENCELQLDADDLIISSASSNENHRLQVSIHHLPTGILVHSSGERNHFANKMKGLNRLKAKLLVIMQEQGITNVSDIRRDAIVDPRNLDTRNYMFYPKKLLHDLKTGIQLSDLSSVLDGNIQFLIGAHINVRQTVAKS